MPKLVEYGTRDYFEGKTPKKSPLPPEADFVMAFNSAMRASWIHEHEAAEYDLTTLKCLVEHGPDGIMRILGIIRD